MSLLTLVRSSRGSLNLEASLLIAFLALTMMLALSTLGQSIACLYKQQAGFVSSAGFWEKAPEITRGDPYSTVRWGIASSEAPYRVLRYRPGTVGQSFDDFSTWEIIGNDTYNDSPAVGLDISDDDSIVVVSDAKTCGVRLASGIWSYSPRSAKLMASNGLAQDYFGWVAGIQDDTIFVGADNTDTLGAESGSVYVFRRTEDTWAEVQELYATWPGNSVVGARFGHAVAIDGDTLAVGATDETWDLYGPGKAGAVYMFSRDPATGWWVQTQRIKDPYANFNSHFGFSIGLEGDIMVVGAPLEDGVGGGLGDAGNAYAFRRNPVSGLWEYEAKLTSSNPEVYGLMGSRVSLSGNTVVVSGHNESVSGGISAGSAYVFACDPNTHAWSLQQRLVDGTPVANERFGREVCISGDTIVCGTPKSDDQGMDSGNATVFTRVGGVWTQQQVITSTDAEAGDQFGGSLVVEGNRLTVGASGEEGNAGAAYIFARTGSVWAQTVKVTAVKNGQPDRGSYDQFGGCVGFSGSTWIVGSGNDNDKAAAAGSLYVFW